MSKAPPPPPGYGPPPSYPGPPTGQPSNVVHVAVQMRFGETPLRMSCPFCGCDVITDTEYKSGLTTWLAVGGICGIGAAFGGLCWLGCCLIPFCVSACKDVVHSCPNCHRQVGKFDRLNP